MKKWIPAAHSSQRFSQKSSTDTISPTLYTKSASLSDTASVYFSFPSIDVISSTSALSQRHFLHDALLRLASSGIFSFTILLLLHFFHPVNSPSSGHAIGVYGTFSAQDRSAPYRLAPDRSAPHALIFGFHHASSSNVSCDSLKSRDRKSVV